MKIFGKLMFVVIVIFTLGLEIIGLSTSSLQTNNIVQANQENSEITIAPSIQSLPDISIPEYKLITFKFNFSRKPTWVDQDEVVSFSSSWNIGDNIDCLKTPDGTFYCSAPPGRYNIEGEEILINWTKKDIDKRQYSVSITVTGDGPVPPAPVPPTPQPTPGTNPFSGIGLKVLLIEEQSERRNLPIQQQAIYSNIIIRQYLDSKCAVDSNGLPEWRIIDQNTIFSSDSQWRRAISLPRTSPFWVVISNGTNWESRELPQSVEEMLVLLKKYGDSQPAQQNQQIRPRQDIPQPRSDALPGPKRFSQNRSILKQNQNTKTKQQLVELRSAELNASDQIFALAQ